MANDSFVHPYSLGEKWRLPNNVIAVDVIAMQRGCHEIPWLVLKIKHDVKAPCVE